MTPALLALISLAFAPARLGVGAYEYGFVLSRPVLRAGPAVIQLQNEGEDSHDLRLRRIGGTRTYRVPEAKPGKVAELDAPLRPGRYRLWCSLADHRRRGMSATLVVRR
jgi:hypothetical protein